MYQAYIEKNENGIVIRDRNNGGSVLTEILKQDYLDLRDIEYSDWILQLCSKIWITMPLLHEMTDIFCKEYPQNEINWVESLRIAESIIDDRK